ncbi:unnamed protein product [Heligmosomoides polygyrus]|uniref:SUN domain-containing protein n=1 Tax=Heligmosomoides polygyrus TaxID=6339 RepID=A0A183FVZ1_HELPZ|nr:unnamed protein product [Heligmosomoides polygyrus]
MYSYDADSNQHYYHEKLRDIEKAVYGLIAVVRSEIDREISEIRDEIEKFKSEKEKVSLLDVKASTDFQRQMAGKIVALEEHLNRRLVDVESRISAASERIRAVTNTCTVASSSSMSEQSVLQQMKKRHAVNLASRSHGAFVVSHLTSKAVTSGSVLYNFVSTVFGLETYNFAITERTHIMPSEAFCFEGAEGKLTIRLWSNASVEAVEYEHDYWHDVVPISAPNRYDVMISDSDNLIRIIQKSGVPEIVVIRIIQKSAACMDHECAAMQLLGECEYPNDEKSGPSQQCEMQNRSVSTDQVQVVFLSNHGQEYTCVYQLRVLNWR